MRNVLLTLCVILIIADRAKADAAEEGSVPFEIHNGYFVSNQFEKEQPFSFLVLSDKADFETVFKVGVVNGEKVHRLADDAFAKKMVLAVIHRGNAVVEYKVQSVKAKGTALTLTYTTHPQKSDSATFASPLIISIEKHFYTELEVIEDGAKIADMQQGFGFGRLPTPDGDAKNQLIAFEAALAQISSIPADKVKACEALITRTRQKIAEVMAKAGADATQKDDLRKQIDAAQAEFDTDTEHLLGEKEHAALGRRALILGGQSAPLGTLKFADITVDVVLRDWKDKIELSAAQTDKAKAILSGLQAQLTKPGSTDEEHFKAGLKANDALRGLLTPAQLEKAEGTP